MNKSAYELQGESQNELWAHIALPAGADTTCYWSPMTDDPGNRWWRDLHWWEQHGAQTTVAIGGNQFSDETVDRAVTVFFDDDARGSVTSSSAARELASSLHEAADRLDEIDGRAKR